MAFLYILKQMRSYNSGVMASLNYSIYQQLNSCLLLAGLDNLLPKSVRQKEILSRVTDGSPEQRSFCL